MNGKLIFTIIIVAAVMAAMIYNHRNEKDMPVAGQNIVTEN